jgi:N,N'-diacetyllegionaminate synthase
MTKHVLIIAEAGVNHNGDYETAKKLIEIAVDAGADYVKFQTFKADKLVTSNAKKADYQIINIQDEDASQYNMLKKLEMPEQWHYDLKAYAASKSIGFLSTGFDEESIDFLDHIGMDLFKIPSGEITNKPYLEHIARKGKHVILSTGMADLEEIRAAIEVMQNCGLAKQDITILHCNTEYPTPMEDVNLGAMNTIREELEVKVGYSDHTPGIEVPIAAVALGASVIEKHFTLDKNMPGPDHLASLEPVELKKMVTAIRNIEKAISGNAKKEPSNSEVKNKSIIRKSLHYKTDLKAGHIIEPEDLIALRPGSGISPMNIGDITGKELEFDVHAYTQVKEKDIK